ncbi:MAG: T9SS type A sorting domain-containing protein [Ignavibacteriales bacterium]|nr:T9SS type A sorting domain-containing protein [Ignavibacteriales bacterium]
MKKLISIVLLFIFFSQVDFTILSAQDQKPVLVSPLNNSRFQKTKNLELVWQSIAGVDIYRCQYSFDPKFIKIEEDLSFGGNALTISELAPDTIYYWRVKTEASDSLWSDIWNFRTTGKPIQPVLFLPANNSKNNIDSLDFIWNYNEVNKSYILQISLDSNFTSFEANVSSRDTAAPVYYFDANTVYFWRVQALNADFETSQWSSVYKYKTKLGKPNFLSPFNNAHNIDTTVTLKWSRIDSADTYRLQLSLKKDFIEPDILLNKEVYTTEYLLDSLAYNKSYFWRILATNKSKDSSSWSNTFSFKTKLAKPFLLSPANNLKNTDTTLVFVWNQVDSAKNYRIQIAKDNLFKSLFLEKLVDTTTIKITGLKYISDYYWRISARNENKDSSGWSTIRHFKTRLGSPRSIAPIDSARNLDTVLVLKWNPVDSTYSYRLQLSIKNDFIDSDLLLNKEISTTEYLLDSLAYNKSYFWRILATNKSKDSSSWSNTFSFKTKLAKPILLSPANNLKNTDTTLRFAWSQVDSAKSYRIQIAKDNLFKSLFLEKFVDTTTIKITGLKYISDYYWRISARNENKDSSGWSTIRHFKTRLGSPWSIAPTDSARNLDTVLVLKWNPVDAAKFYKLQLSLSNYFQQDSILFDKKLSATSNKFDSLKTNTRFYWRVMTHSNTGDSSLWSKVYNFKTRLSNPRLLSPIDSTLNLDTVITLVWNKIENADKYKLIVAEDNKFANIFFEKDLKVTQIKIDSLLYFKKYFWKVLASNKNKDSSYWSDTSYFKTRLVTPLLISPKDSSRNNQLNLTLSWAAIPGATSYKLQLSDHPLFAEPLIDTSITKVTFKPSHLAFDSLYFWRIRANNLGEDSSLWSKIYRFRTRPSILIIQDSLKKSINLSVSSSDTIGTIIISNAGVNQYVIDSIKIKPDSIFFLSQKNAVIQPNSISKFLLRFNTHKADTGLNRAMLYLIRTNNLSGRDTLKLELAFTLKQSKVGLNSDTLIFDNTAASHLSNKILTIKNIGGNYPLVVNKIFIEGTDTNSYKLIKPVKVIKANDSVSFNVEFKPFKPGKHQALIQLQTNSYPVKNFTVLLVGTGIGGELSPESITAINKVMADTFETFNNNNKKIFFRNIGNDWLNCSIKFPKKRFKVTNDFQNTFSLKPNDTITVGIKYLTPNFDKVSIDTLSIIHNGFGKDTIYLPIDGGIDSLQSVIKLKSNLRFNNEPFNSTLKILEVNQAVTLTLNPSLFTFQNNLDFRIIYYLGGPGVKHYSYNDGNYNFIIPKSDITDKGLIFFGDLISRNINGLIVDSISVFDSIDVQTIIPKLKTVSISVPRSKAAENSQNANVKWTMFGFPFEDVVADSVFKYFGGIKNMKDGEWVVYEYNPSAPDSFSLFNNYYFKETSAYFAAQSLVDTFKISYLYPQNIRSRKLADNVLTFNSNGWKTISSPYFFDVQIDTTLILRKYDPNNKSYKMTNIMKPGEGYFVEPEVKRIKLKTFGKYNPLYFPKILADIGWFVKLTIADETTSNELFFSVFNSNNKLSKSGLVKSEYLIPPKLQNGLEAYITNEILNTKSDVSIKQNAEGATWDFIIGNTIKNNSISIKPEMFGSFPKEYQSVIFDIENNKLLDLKNISIGNSNQHSYRMIIGTEKFVNETLKKFQNEIVKDFRLWQNYPNPFNPSTTINYAVPISGFVTLKIFDVLGKEVTTLVNEEKPAGKYSVEFNANSRTAGLTSGIYFYTLRAGKFIQTKKMVVLK